MYSLSHIAKVLNWKLFQGDGDLDFSELVIDSRKISQASKSLFIALNGPRHNGHAFIRQAWEKGVRLFVVSETPDVRAFPDSSFALVPDCLQALQSLAAYHRSQFTTRVLAITGSNGKTIVKEWINQLLTEDISVLRSPRSYNSQVGVPLSVWNLGKEHDIGIFEAGISKPGEMQALASIIKPQCGLFLNVGSAHIENFSSQQQIAFEKAKLFANCEEVYYNADQDLLLEALQQEGFRGKLFSWSLKGNEADLKLLTKRTESNKSFLQVLWKNEQIDLEIPFTDEASISNILAAVCFVLNRGMSLESLQQRLLRLSPLSMRLEVLEGINGAKIINDSYSADLHSLKIALDYLHQQAKGRRKLVMLSDFEQTGMSQQELYKAISQQLDAHGIDALYAAGKEISNQKEQFHVPAFLFPSTEKLLDELETENLGESIILIKAARSFKFERIIQRLQEKAHDTVLEIDLEKVVHNINQFRSALPSGTGIIAMVKAFSYGSGSVEIAKVLEYQRIAYLAVAYTDEGVALRKAGINLPILVLNPERSSFDAIIRYRLEPEIYSKTTLLNLKKELASAPEKWPWPVHIKLETGMNRLGFAEAEIEELCKLLHLSPELKVVSVFSHLAASEDAQLDWFTREQISRFKQMSETIESSLSYPVLKHLANSAGMLRFPESRFDMVRLGIGMYGIEPGQEKLGLHPVSRLRTIVSQVREIVAGESVGYGRSFIAANTMQIAVLPIGYADGYRRSLGRGAGKVWIKGKLCPVIGNVCMDMLMVDVSGLQVTEGDEVTVFGDEPSVTQLAEWAGTIAYEILTSVSPRVKRVFIQEGI